MNTVLPPRLNVSSSSCTRAWHRRSESCDNDYQGWMSVYVRKLGITITQKWQCASAGPYYRLTTEHKLGRHADEAFLESSEVADVECRDHCSCIQTRLWSLTETGLPYSQIQSRRRWGSRGRRGSRKTRISCQPLERRFLGVGFSEDEQKPEHQTLQVT